MKMGVSSGYKQSLFAGNETKYGSQAVINKCIGLVQNVNPTETNNLIKVRTLGGTRDYSNIVPGKFEVSGSFEYYLQNGIMLRQAIGEDTGSTGVVDSGPKVHSGASYLHILGSAAAPGVNDFPSFSLEFTDAEDSGADAGTQNLKRIYTGCRINNLAISATVDAPLRCTADWIGQMVNISTAAATNVTEQTTDPYVFYQGWVYSTSGAISRYTQVTATTGTRLAEVNGFDLSVSNNLEPVWYISGTTEPFQTKRCLKELVPKGRDYDANLNLHFRNRQMYQRFLGSNTATKSLDTLASYYVVIDFVRSGTIGASPKAATNDWIRIVFPDAKFATANITGAPEDIVAQNIGVAVKSARIYIVDDIASYK
jgi:hypothetical protein